MIWHPPLKLRLVPTNESESFKTMGDDETGLPLAPHPGSFGFVRKNHIHEGVDLYAPEGTMVHAVEEGTIVRIFPFTGPHAGSPWWHDTWAMMVEGESGVVLYGEINPLLGHWKSKRLMRGDPLGRIATVLTKDKGRPMSMLHLELYEHGANDAVEWLPGADRPKGLLDPTERLLAGMGGLL